MRNVAAVVVPWLVWGLLDTAIYKLVQAVAPESFGLAGRPTEAILVLFLLLRAVYSVIAGWLAARLAGGHPDVAGRGPARVVWTATFILLATGIIAQVVNWSASPLWYHLAFLGSIVPCVRLGARLGRQGA